MTTELVPIDREGMKKATRKGVIAAILLAVLTVIEYFVAIGLDDPLLALIPFVLLKGWVILDVFMHVRQVFREGGH
jgi:hypothetical protein